MIIDTRKREILWTDISKFGKNRIIQSANVWIVIVPLIVLLFKKTNRIIHLDSISKDIVIDFTMPITWEIVYLGGVIATLANVLYSIFCPRIIKKFEGYSDFIESGRTDIHLAIYEQKMNVNVSDIELVDLETSIRFDYTNYNREFILSFWKLYFFADRMNKFFRYLTFSMYVLSIVLVITVVIINFISVTKFMHQL